MAAALKQRDAELLAQTVWRVRPHTYATTASGGRWRPYRHLRYMSNVIAEAVRNGDGRVIINCPPRHGKSELASFWTPVWFLDAYPDKRVIIVSYAAEVATDWGRRVRNELGTNELCLTRLQEDSKAAGRWNTPEGGGMIAAGVGGPITGRGGDLIIIDDPYKNWQDACSALYRHKLTEWFNSTLYTRCEPHATIIVVQQRWHEDDLCGHLIEQHADNWAGIKLPAVAEAGDALGRNEGEPLCPERYSLAQLKTIRAAAGEVVWNALYQQRPAAGGVGRCYRNYSSDNLSEDVTLRDDLPLQLAVDFGAKLHLQCVIGQHDERNDELTAVHQLDHGEVRCARDAGFAFCDLVSSLGGWRWPELHLFGDATGQHAGRNTATGESDWTVLVQAIRSRLPKIEIRKRMARKNPPRVDRINAYNEALRDIEGTVHYVLHPRCRQLLTDLKEVKTDESGLPVKTDPLLTHASDADGYRIHRLRPVRMLAEQSGTSSISISMG